MAGQPRFTRIPKTTELLAAGCPTEVIPTYCCLADYANNKTGLCFPKMESLAVTLNRSVRTVQRHLHLLKDLGLIEFVERRRNKGRFSSYLYKVLHICRTTGHARLVARGGPNKDRTKRAVTPSSPPPKTDFKEGYWWFFGEKPPPGAQEEWDRQQQAKRKQEERRRTQGYEWFFGK